MITNLHRKKAAQRTGEPKKGIPTYPAPRRCLAQFKLRQPYIPLLSPPRRKDTTPRYGRRKKNHFHSGEHHFQAHGGPEKADPSLPMRTQTRGQASMPAEGRL